MDDITELKYNYEPGSRWRRHGRNNPKFKNWRPATGEGIAKLESEIRNRLDSIQKITINQENSREKDSNPPVFVNFVL
ncbi:hypothetical protein [Methanosarcina sp.]|uniref:hypothetical protein n=1 Tax=Methanosarcina sp. TaxID=2213 RepID=UPI003C774C12